MSSWNIKQFQEPFFYNYKEKRRKKGEGYGILRQQKVWVIVGGGESPRDILQWIIEDIESTSFQGGWGQLGFAFNSINISYHDKIFRIIKRGEEN